MNMMKQVLLRGLYAALLCCLLGAKVHAQTTNRKAPGIVDMSKIKIDIVAARFVTRLEGVNGYRYEAQKPEEYRGMVAVLRIQKPAGMPVKLTVQDLAMHYTYGGDTDISPCRGLSVFSTDRNVDRPMNFFKHFGGVKTAVASSEASVVYVDAFFDFMEPTTRDLHLAVAQPTGAYFRASGWRP